MKKLMMAALIGLIAACGGGGSSKPKADARPPITTDPIDAPPGGGGDCNVLANTGCATGEKCTWVIDSFMGRDAVGRVACAPTGAKKLGEMCQIGNGMMNATGSDDCEGGLYCSGRVCKTVCDPAGGEPMCGENRACATYNNTFGNKGEAVAAGVCDPTCDPLTQRVDGVAGAAGDACGGMVTEGVPTRGCYGFWRSGNRSRWSCAGAGDPLLTQDKVLAEPVFINSCAAGFWHGLLKESGSMEQICSAHCRATDVSLEAPGITGGAPAADSCGVRMKTPTSGVAAYDCIRGFIFEIENNMLTTTKYSNLGICISLPRFEAMPGVPSKQCKELTRGMDQATDEAWGNGCLAVEKYVPLPVLGSSAVQVKRSPISNYISPAYSMDMQ